MVPRNTAINEGFKTSKFFSCQQPGKIEKIRLPLTFSNQSGAVTINYSVNTDKQHCLATYYSFFQLKIKKKLPPTNEISTFTKFIRKKQEKNP